MRKLLLSLLLITGFALYANAQNPDTAAVKPVADSVGKKARAAKVTPPVPAASVVKRSSIPDSTHSPHKAVIRSLIIPGWGQLYNGKWWKVPIVYGGLGLIGAAIVFNQTYYNQFLALAIYRRRGEQPQPGDKYYKEYQAYATAPDDFFENALNGYRRNRDLAILGMLGAWGIQMIDAYIDAKFIQAYSIDENLSFKVRPGFINQPVFAMANGPVTVIPALKVTFAF